MSSEPQRAPASKGRDKERERDREEQIGTTSPKLAKSKLRTKEEERDIGRTTFNLTNSKSPHSSSTYSHSQQQKPTRHYHKVHPSVSPQGRGATPYYTALGSASGRVVTVGGPEDSWSDVGFHNPLQLLGRGKKDHCRPRTQLLHHIEVEVKVEESNHGHLDRRYAAESLGWKALSGGVEHVKAWSDRLEKPRVDEKRE
ncbi:hypothetical protein BDN72DRAFT_897756 [Pluteus cervinus]|uniref:Uncharacterized protein n=1 Tax=Pluteus cervinus TaxID=181527 RepID=A0ACD3ASC9_9AGAR|nr:hypothetical protein BDN72DRAFT_897756 [Pluteus cervinus]